MNSRIPIVAEKLNHRKMTENNSRNLNIALGECVKAYRN